MPHVVNSACILCGACISGCKVGAIREGETQAMIDPAVCIACGICQAICPCEAISLMDDEPAGGGQPRSLPVRCESPVASKGKHNGP